VRYKLFVNVFWTIAIISYIFIGMMTAGYSEQQCVDDVANKYGNIYIDYVNQCREEYGLIWPYFWGMELAK
jgi:hypothetical protein